MKKCVMAAAVFAAISLNASAGADNDLRFSRKGEFRIVQFTDTHIDPGNGYRLGEAEKTFARISRTVSEEKPDLIIFTGDVVTGTPAKVMWDRLLDSLDRFAVPFVVVFGNHDAEQDMSRQEMSSLIVSSRYSLNRLNPAGELDDLQIVVRPGSGKGTAAALYCLDSHDYSTIDGVEGYGWFTRSQVNWFLESSEALSASNGGKPVPSLAFFHIVLQEYLNAWRNPDNTHIGRAAEDECPGALNTGMYAAMVESGSVMGTFVGHDHDIDYVVAENGIALGYGRFSGDDTTYNNLRPGARVIVLREGKREFESWIIEDDGRKTDHMVFTSGKVVHKD